VRLARQRRQQHFVRFPQLLRQLRNSRKTFDPAGTPRHNEGKTWRFSNFEKGICR